MRRRFSLLARCGTKPSGGGQESILALLLNTKANAVEDAAEALKTPKWSRLFVPTECSGLRKNTWPGKLRISAELEDWENFDRWLNVRGNLRAAHSGRALGHDFEGFFRILALITLTSTPNAAMGGRCRAFG